MKNPLDTIDHRDPEKNTITEHYTLFHTYYCTEYLKNGLLHRNSGPAYMDIRGHQEYYQNGIRHRLDGPATIYPDGTTEHYINGKRTQ